MLDLILTREVMIAMAIMGAVLSVLGSVVQTRVGAEDLRVKALVWSGYGCMGISIAIFVFVGLVDGWQDVAVSIKGDSFSNVQEFKAKT